MSFDLFVLYFVSLVCIDFVHSQTLLKATLDKIISFPINEAPCSYPQITGSEYFPASVHKDFGFQNQQSFLPPSYRRTEIRCGDCFKIYGSLSAAIFKIVDIRNDVDAKILIDNRLIDNLIPAESSKQIEYELIDCQHFDDIKVSISERNLNNTWLSIQNSNVDIRTIDVRAATNESVKVTTVRSPRDNRYSYTLDTEDNLIVTLKGSNDIAKSVVVNKNATEFYVPQLRLATSTPMPATNQPNNPFTPTDPTPTPLKERESVNAAAVVGLMCLLLVLFTTIIWLAVIYWQRRSGDLPDEHNPLTVPEDEAIDNRPLNLPSPHPNAVL